MESRRSSQPVLRPTTPTGRFNRHHSARSPSAHSSSPFASIATSAFSAPRSLRRPTSPATRVSLYKPTAQSLTFSLDRTGSPNRFKSVTTGSGPAATAAGKRTCLCSPTNHPGSFRCSQHKSAAVAIRPKTASYGNSTRLNMMRSAMKNSLVRIGAVEGEIEKRALAALIRPSSHQQRRRGEFQPRRPSRLSLMSNC